MGAQVFCAAMVEVRYHTDPACPWSWALEPAVRKLMVDVRRTSSMDLRDGRARPRPARGASGPAPRLAPATHLRLVEEWLRVSRRDAGAARPADLGRRARCAPPIRPAWR